MGLRPFYRSRLFWFGLPGLAFLLWGWWDSWRHYSEVAWVKPQSMMIAYHHQGHIGFVVTEETRAPAFSGDSLQFMFREDWVPFWQGAPGVSGLFGVVDPPKRDHYEEARVYVFPGIYRRRWSLPYMSPPLASGSCSWLPYWEAGVDWWLVVAVYACAWFLALLGWRRRKSRLLKRGASLR